MDWCHLTAWQIAGHVRQKEVSCEEVTRAALQRIQSTDSNLRAFLTVMEASALRQAREQDDRLAHGEVPGPLSGVPVALKDNLCTRNERTTCASRLLENYRPPYTSTAAARLQAAGAIILGKTNMDEFAMGSSTENSGFFPSRNPWDPNRSPGGSSGGSAVAVAAGQVALSLGSDTGGSVRQPASFCGIVGLKPTYGRVSRYGLVAYASSLDQIGPLARDVRDAALALNLIAGADPADSTCSSEPVPDYTSALRADVKGLRIGLPRELFGAGVDPAMAEQVYGAARTLADAGAELVEISLPSLEHTLSVYYILAPAEASSNLARYDGVEYGYRSSEARDTVGMYMATRDEGFGNEVKQRILIGTYALSAGYYDAYYLKAQQVRTLVRREFEDAFKQCDLIASPTSPTPAFRLGEKTNDPMAMKLADVLTVPANIAGVPAISVPCGQIDGLPAGLQLMGKPFDETTLLRCAYTFEQTTDYHLQRPPLPLTAETLLHEEAH